MNFAKPTVTFGAAPTTIAATAAGAPAVGAATATTTLPSFGFGAAQPPAAPTSNAAPTFGAAQPVAPLTQPAAQPGVVPSLSLPPFGAAQPTATAPAAAAAPAMSAFGAAAPRPAAPPLGTAPGALTLPGQVGGAAKAPLTSKTKFEDLPQDWKTAVLQVAELVEAHRSASNKIASKRDDTEFEMKKLKEDRKALELRVGSLRNDLNRDRAVIQQLVQEAAKELKTGESAARAFDVPLLSGSQRDQSWMLVYFSDLAKSFEERMQIYQIHIEELENHLVSASQQNHRAPQALSDTMRSQNESFLALAAKVAGLHEKLNELRDEYMRFQNPESNPFSAAKKLADEEQAKKKAARATVKTNAIVTRGFDNQQFSMQQQQQQQQQPRPLGFGAAPTLGAPGAFGAPRPTTAPATGFGAPTTTGFGGAPAVAGFGAPRPAGFGAPTATTGFGAPAPTGFGAPAAPAAPSGFGAQPPATGFGAQPATTGFGAPATTGFGAPASTGFGAPAAAAAPPAFGAPAASGFGAPAAGTGFGAATTGFSAKPTLGRQGLSSARKR